MAYFIPLGVQKRLLRYALSRLELLDMDQLDLEKFDISLGKKSTINLKDIAIRTEKLSLLLHLPKQIQLLHARILQLRVIIPADIYGTGIIIHVDGVTACAQLAQEQHEDLDPYERGGFGKKRSETARSTETQREINEEVNDGPGSDDHIPTPADLAKSFLLDKGVKKDKDLQYALSSQSQSLQESDILQESELEISEEGTGTTLSMPRFLTNFLQGIVDRLQVTIENVQLTLRAEVEINDRNNIGWREAPLSIIMRIREVDVGALPSIALQATRKIQLNEITGSLVCDPCVLASLSRISSPLSPTSTRSPEPSIRKSPPEPAQHKDAADRSEPTKNNEELQESLDNHDILSPLNDSNSLSALGSQQLNRLARLEDSTLTNDSDRFADAGRSSPSQQDIQVQQSDVGLVGDSEGASSQFDDAKSVGYFDEAVTSQQKLPEPKLSATQVSKTVNLPPTSIASTPLNGLEGIEPNPITTLAPRRDFSLGSEEYSKSPKEGQHSFNVRPKVNDDSSNSGSSSNNEDLSHSMLFSHEEAASMYYSITSARSRKDKPELSVSDAAEFPSLTTKPTTTDKVEPRLAGSGSSVICDDHAKDSLNHRTLAHHNVDCKLSDNDDLSNGSNIAKQFMYIDRAIISIPGSHNPPTDEEIISKSSLQPLEMDTQASDTNQEIPGAFSKYAEAGGRRNGRSSKIHSTRLRKQTLDGNQGSDPVRGSGNERSHEDQMNRVNIGSVSLDIDMSRGRLLYEVLNQLLSSISAGGQSDKTRRTRSMSETTISYELCVDSIILRIIGETAAIASDASNRAKGESHIFEPNKVVLLKMTVTKYAMLSQLTSSAHQVDLSVLDFRFAFENEDIISFDARARMRTSMRDLKEPQANVLSCSVLITENQADIQISTLPVLISLDIHKIDDFLGACGGVGSIIELGTSINSNSTIQRLSQAERQQLKNMDIQNPLSAEQKLSTEIKCNARVAGSLIALKARSCWMTAKTSAIKLICRSKNLAIQVDEAIISNPEAETSIEESTLVHLTNNRIQFLFTPEEADLDQLVALVAPSRGGYETNDDVLLDTLLAQRKRGSLLRTTTSIAKLDIPHLKVVRLFQHLGDELAKLTAVKKYLPAESRPGMLLLVSVEQFDVKSKPLDDIGAVNIQCQKLCIAYVAVPLLLALSVDTLTAKYQNNNDLVREVPGSSVLRNVPMVLACFLGDDLESSLKMKLNNTCCEYSVPIVMAITNVIEEATSEDYYFTAEASTSTMTENASIKSFAKHSSHDSLVSAPSQVLKLSIFFQNCGIGLNPHAADSKGLFVFTNAKFSMDTEGKSKICLLDVSKASFLVIDKVANIKDEASEEWTRRDRIDVAGGKHIEYLCGLGYVSVSTISSAKASVKISDHGKSAALRRSIDVDLKDELFVLETCADSTQTMVEVLSGLKLPSKPSKDARFRTEVVPMQDMMASFSGDAFTEFENAENSEPSFSQEGNMLDDASSEDLEFTESLYDLETVSSTENFNEDFLHDDLQSLGTPSTADVSEKSKMKSDVPTLSKSYGNEEPDLNFRENYFDTEGGVSKRGQKRNDKDTDHTSKKKPDYFKSPFTFKLRDVHIIWNLFDGFDWPETRETIATAVKDLEVKAEERRREREKYMEPKEEEPVIGDYLFNSIWIDIPPNKNPRDLYGQVNRDVNDRVSETESYATSAVSSSPSRVPKARIKSKRLKLGRGRHHKITFELRGVSADVIIFPPGASQTQASTDIRVMNFEVFDHVPSSTWKKFATYMHDAGEREMGKPMVRLEIRTVKPVLELAASELVLRVSILPLRLHVDQDALDFIIRFFEFRSKDEKKVVEQQEEIFIQRVEVNKVVLKLDYKPKKVDYTGLHSGHTNELMNFFILDGSDIVLRHAIIYGVSGFDKLHKTLNDIWMPDVKRNQLPGVLAGLAPVRSLVNVGGGVRDLVVIPMKEYRKDGRIVRSIRKGALAFARTTTSELARFGAKLAIGTQNVLQGTEDMLANSAERGSSGQDWDTEITDHVPPTSDALKIPLSSPSLSPISSSPSSGPNPVRAVSNYADQPIGVLAGLRGAARSLERDLLTARDAVIAIQGEVMESDSAGTAAKAVARRAPTVILRPAIGASKAVGMTLLGAGNALDKDSRRRIEDKYKRV